VAGFFGFAGVGHFTNAEFFVAIVPPYLPAAEALVVVSGVFEILGAFGVLIPQTRRFSGWGLLILLVAVYPANLHMALNPDLFPDISATALYARLPVQFVFAGLVFYATAETSFYGTTCSAPSSCRSIGSPTTVWASPTCGTSRNASTAYSCPPSRRSTTACRGHDPRGTLRQALGVVVISDVLGVAAGSVKAHVAASLERLNASNRTEAVMLLRELEMDEDP
jgi:uncharacterized membrane protein